MEPRAYVHGVAETHGEVVSDLRPDLQADPVTTVPRVRAIQSTRFPRSVMTDQRVLTRRRGTDMLKRSFSELYVCLPGPCPYTRCAMGDSTVPFSLPATVDAEIMFLEQPAVKINRSINVGIHLL